MPIGWPRAMAPPFTFTTSSVTPRSAIDASADRGEGLVDLEQVDVADLQVRPAPRAALMARLGWCSSDTSSGPATWP